MSFGGKSRNRAEQARFDRIKAGPCLACLQRGIDLSGQWLVEVHHLAGKKRHDLTVGLCIWSHRGVPFWGCTHEEMRSHYGPALSEGSKPFRDEFGTDAELLAIQNDLLGEIA